MGKEHGLGPRAGGGVRRRRRRRRLAGLGRWATRSALPYVRRRLDVAPQLA